MELKDARILIVDDEPALREIFAAWLRRAGCHDVRTAEDGLQALDALLSQPVDLLISDIRMPNMDGLTLVRKLWEAHVTIPCILFISGFGDVDRREMYALGVHAFLSKPLGAHDLLHEVNTTLADRATIWAEPMLPHPKQTLIVSADLSPTSKEDRIRFGSNGFAVAGTGIVALGKLAFCCRSLSPRPSISSAREPSAGTPALKTPPASK